MRFRKEYASRRFKGLEQFVLSQINRNETEKRCDSEKNMQIVGL
jgi:hypothetical protein